MPTNLIYTAEDISAALSLLNNVYGRIDDTNHYTFVSWGAGGDQKTIQNGTIVPTSFGEKKSLKIFTYQIKKSYTANPTAETISFTNINFVDDPMINVSIEINSLAGTLANGFATASLQNVNADGCSVKPIIFTSKGVVGTVDKTNTATVTIHLTAIGY